MTIVCVLCAVGLWVDSCEDGRNRKRGGAGLYAEGSRFQTAASKEWVTR